MQLLYDLFIQCFQVASWTKRALNGMVRWILMETYLALCTGDAYIPTIRLIEIYITF